VLDGITDMFTPQCSNEHPREHPSGNCTQIIGVIEKGDCFLRVDDLSEFYGISADGRVRWLFLKPFPKNFTVFFGRFAIIVNSK
jgi:hypothetical protein